jgi:folate-binding Fe-S cluster repair protein YgfZ
MLFTKQDDGVVVTFRNDSVALDALENGTVLVDRSHWGRLRVAGDGRAAFLHGQTTADISALVPGQGCDTVLTTAQARCLDLATVYVQVSGIMLVVSPQTTAAIAQRLEKHIMPLDKASR